MKKDILDCRLHTLSGQKASVTPSGPVESDYGSYEGEKSESETKRIGSLDQNQTDWNELEAVVNGLFAE